METQAQVVNPKSFVIMKSLLTSLLLLTLTLLFSSCVDEDLLSEVLAENAGSGNGDTPDGETGDDEVFEYEGTLEINTTPCDYGLDILEANATLAIDCQLDLGGETVTLPSNVTLEYNGGEIINGSLTFNGGKIDGNLLNHELGIEGDVSLTSDTFQMHPERWDLVQGNTTSEIAQKNNNNLEGLFEFTKELGATNFLIDRFDAYFEISKVTSTTTNQNFYPSLEAINIPSDFNLAMTENTHLRTYPNGEDNGILISFREVSNSSIKGGILHGERDEHSYSDSSSGEGGNHLMTVHAANNITIDGVKLTMGSKGGLFINALRFVFQPDYLPSHDIVVKNCVFERNRRMSVALTDGYNIVFENNTFIDTALDRPNSNGGVVGFAVNIEPVRKRDAATGELVLYEKVHDVTLRNNTERGSRVGAFNIFVGDNIIIENNDFENKVGWSFASNSKVRNNTFTASSKSAGVPAINAGGSGETVFNNEISGNTVIGYGTAIAVYLGKLKIFDNTLKENKTGIQLKEVTDTEIFNNVITSSDVSSRGLNLHLTWAKDVLINANEISVAKDQIYCVFLNQDPGEENYGITITNNKFLSDSKLTFSSANGVNFSNNEIVGGMQLINTESIEVLGNTINANVSHGIHLMSNNFDVQIGDNTINVPANSNFECIKNDSGGQINIQQDNTCAD